MEKSQRVRYEMLQRVRDFGIANRDRFPEGSAPAEAFAAIARAIADIDKYGDQKRITAAEGHNAIVVMSATVRRLMRVIARTARGIEPGSPERRTLRMPSRCSYKTLVDRARTFLAEATEIRATLERLRMPATLPQELGTAIEGLETALTDRREGRRDVAAAQQGIEKAFAAGFAAARALDIMIPNEVESDPVLFAAWRRDRRVVEAKPQKAAAKADTTAPVDPARKAS